MSLGLGNSGPSKPIKPFQIPKGAVPSRMMTTEAALPGLEISASLGPVEGLAEVAMRGVAIPHLEMHEGGKLQDLVWSARQSLADAAGELGADAVIGLRYVIAGRDYEKSVLAFGTAVTCSKLERKVD